MSVINLGFTKTATNGATHNFSIDNTDKFRSLVVWGAAGDAVVDTLVLDGLTVLTRNGGTITGSSRIDIYSLPDNLTTISGSLTVSFTTTATSSLACAFLITGSAPIFPNNFLGGQIVGGTSPLLIQSNNFYGQEEFAMLNCADITSSATLTAGDSTIVLLDETLGSGRVYWAYKVVTTSGLYQVSVSYTGSRDFDGYVALGMRAAT
jgi:hypothetical protein